MTLKSRGRVASSSPIYSGPSLLELLDGMPMVDRKTNGPLMMPVSEKYKDMGCVVVGKIESGRLRKGDPLMLMPNKVGFSIRQSFWGCIAHSVVTFVRRSQSK